jgi:hypothetical protein
MGGCSLDCSSPSETGIAPICERAIALSNLLKLILQCSKRWEICMMQRDSIRSAPMNRGQSFWRHCRRSHHLFFKIETLLPKVFKEKPAPIAFSSSPHRIGNIGHDSLQQILDHRVGFCPAPSVQGYRELSHHRKWRSSCLDKESLA